MCLGSIKNVAREFVGFKLLHDYGNGVIAGMCYSDTDYSLRRWYSAIIRDGYRDGIKAEEGGRYPCGFHILPSVRDALKYIKHGGYWSSSVALAVVSYRGVLASGIDSTTEDINKAKVKCVIAAQMRIDQLIPRDQMEEYLASLLPKPKRRTITTDEFVQLYMNANSLAGMGDQLSAMLGYNVFDDVAERRTKKMKE